MITPPQGKTGFSKMQNPQVEEAKKQVAEMMRETGVTSAQLRDVGKAAEVAIYNKKLYPIFVQKMMKHGLADRTDFRGGVDYQALALFATIAKLV